MSLHLFNFYFLPILYVCAVAIEEWESIYMLSYIYLPVGWEKHFIILGISDISLKINALYNSSTDVRLSAANLKWNGQIWKKMFFLSRLVISFCLLLFQTKKLCNLVNNKQIATQNFYRNASRINLLDNKVKACDVKNPICQLQVWPVDQQKLIEI